MAHALRRVSLSIARPSDAQFAFVAHNPGSHDTQLYCHLFKARHARAVRLHVTRLPCPHLLLMFVIQSHTSVCVMCLRPSSWTCWCAAASSYVIWRNIQKSLRPSHLGRSPLVARPCWTTASLSASAPWCPFVGHRHRVCCLWQRLGWKKSFYHFVHSHKMHAHISAIS